MWLKGAEGRRAPPTSGNWERKLSFGRGQDWGKETGLQSRGCGGQGPLPQTSSPVASALRGCGCLLWVLWNQAHAGNQVLKNPGTAAGSLGLGNSRVGWLVPRVLVFQTVGQPGLPTQTPVSTLFSHDDKDDIMLSECKKM